MKSLTERYWKLPSPFVASQREMFLSKKLQLEPEILRILGNRGLKEETEIIQFLYPTLNDLESASTLKGIDESCSLLYDALKNKQKIIIWGDYDVDGVTATSLLIRFFTSLNCKPDWFVPNRLEDGYGLNKNILSKYAKKYSKNTPPVLITVDCGISNSTEIEYIKSKGWKVIVTDHHETGELHLAADAIINVKQEGCEFSNKDLSGVGTAFYLCIALRSFLNKKKYFNNIITVPNLKNLLDLVAIGTIADMVPQSNGNRVLIKGGFEIINSNPSVGVGALMSESNIHSNNITSEDIAFQIAPRINAAGRMGDASLAVKLLTETRRKNAATIAKKLTRLNTERKKECTENLEYTLTIIGNKQSNGQKILIQKIDCPLGVIGIVASQLVNKLRIPVILITEIEDKIHGKVLKGSCRSVPWVNIYQLLYNTREFHLEYGGHKMAAGVTLLESNVEQFRNAASLIVEKEFVREREYEKIDVEIPIEKALSDKLIKEFQLLEPFGIKNEKPTFVERKIIPCELRQIGKLGDHISFIRKGKFTNNKCIAFGFGEYENYLKNVEKVDAIYTTSVSRFKKAVHWQAQMIDFL